MAEYCPNCGAELFDNEDGTFDCCECEETFDYDDLYDVPPGCESCGGPYPQCKSSCKLFDD